MRHNINFFRIMFRMLYEALFAVLLVVFGAVIFLKRDTSIFDYVIILIMFVMSYVIREGSKRNIYNLILHCLIGAVVSCLPLSEGIKGLVLAVNIYLFIASSEYIVRGCKLKPLDDMPWPTFLISFVFYLFGWYTKSEELTDASIIIPILLLVIYYMMTYIEGLKVYIDATKDVQGLPLEKVVARNNLIVFLIIVVLIVAIIIGINTDFSEVFNEIRRVFMAVFRFIGSVFMIFYLFLNRMISTGDTSIYLTEDKNSGKANIYIDNAAQSFELILYGMLIILVAFLLLRIMRVIIKRLLQRTCHENDIVEVSESIKDNRVVDKKPRLFLGRLSPDDRARKFYKQAIQRYRHSIRLGDNKTCRDIQHEIQLSQLGDVNELTDMYADIRYGGKETDKKILKKMSSLSK